MRDVPELTFRGALSVLGHYDRPVLDRLNTLLGGVVIVGGVVALTGPVAAPAVALAAIWGWVDQKNEAIGLVRKLLDRIGEHRAAARGFDRTRLIAAAHTVLVVSSVVDTLRDVVGKKAFKKLEITDNELSTLLASTSTRRTSEVIYDSAVPMPSSGNGYVETLVEVQKWQDQFTRSLIQFCRGLNAGKAVAELDSRQITEPAIRRYQNQYRQLAAQVPEFLVWTMLTEFGATQDLLVNTREEVRDALADHARAMARFESLLTVLCGAVPDQLSVLHRAARARLDEPVVTQDAASISMLDGIQFPLIRDIFVQPDYRFTLVAPHSRIADEQWWQTQPRRDDLDLRLVAHLTSPEATRLPLLVLGHPGAGKSVLMKVLAARFPSEGYTTVYAPLRHVSSTAPVYEQVEQALRAETNGRVDWVGLGHESQNTTTVVLLDGLDEMLQATDRDRARYLHEVTEFQWREATQGRPVVVLVTSRTLVADRVEVPSGTPVIKLEAFDSSQVEQWREVWNACNQASIEARIIRELTEEAIAHQQELARQPLLLLMLAVYSADLSFPPIDSRLSKTALYRMLFDSFTKREATKVPDTVQPQDQLKRLSVAALGMFNRGRQHITDTELAGDLEILAPDRELRPEPEQRLVAQFFFIHTAEANLSTTKASRSYEFLHATFGEYLVAREVVETLVDTADSTVSRYGRKEPDDDRLFALLSHDCLAARGPTLDFIADLLAELQPIDRTQIFQTVVTLLANARHRQGSTRYDEYRPTQPDHIRAIAAYTANLVLLAVMTDPEEGILLDDLTGEPAKWRSTLNVWRAGLTADSWYALLATIDRDTDRLRLTIEHAPSTDLEADVLQAKLADDDERCHTLRWGHTLRSTAVTAFGLNREDDPTAREELLAWLAALLAFGCEPDGQPIHPARLEALVNAVTEPHDLQLMITMVLKQRADRLSPDVTRVLVAYLIDERCADVYAFIAAAAAHPELLDEFPQLFDAYRYEGRHGAELMVEGLTRTEPELRFLLDSVTPHEDRTVAAAALLDAFQWRIDP
jgi:hypothetical protein